MQKLIPSSSELSRFTRIYEANQVDSLLEKSLLNPLNDFLGRPSKLLRGKCVEAGFDLSDGQNLNPSDTKKLIELGAQVVEALHAGSLVVDDIQDESESRRGSPTLHRNFGVPLALNAGNWLYFWPMKVIQEFGLDEKIELCLYRLIHDTLLRAHFGQAIDIGTKMSELPQAEVKRVCLASLELKSGALMSLALQMGAALGGGSKQCIDSLESMGHQFGVSLQKFDDIGNIRAAESGEPLSEKRQEDLKNESPSWIWGMASEILSDSEYSEWKIAFSKFPDEKPVREFLRKHQVAEKAYESAKQELDQVMKKFSVQLEHQSVDEKMRHRWQRGLLVLAQIQERLYKAYG